MLDHVFLDAVSALGRALDETLLQRDRHEDRLASDLLLGDLVWETSVSLPGDGTPSRVRADLTLDWPTWSQSAWRSWALGEPLEEPPEIGLEIVFRVQRLASRPDPEALLAQFANQEPPGVESFERSSVVAEEDLGSGEVALEVAFEGAFRLADPDDGPRREPFGPDGLSNLDATGVVAVDRSEAAEIGRAHLRAAEVAGQRGSLSSAMSTNLIALGRWVASTLVRLADLEVEFLPAEEP